MFENRIIKGIHVSRYVASWWKIVRKSGRTDVFIDEWLKQLIIDGEPLTDEEVMFITNFSMNGKLELEANVRNFISS